MQHIYLATITAGHDFESVVAKVAFNHRADAQHWATVTKEQKLAEAIAHDPSFEYGFRFNSSIEAIEHR